MGVRSRRRNPKRRRAATESVGGGGGGVDLISRLNDDLLLRILDQVPDAENVVRTHALSRRWRGLWTRVAALRFDFDSWPKHCRSYAAAERYIAFVSGALALRATQPAAFLQDLAISFDISNHETGHIVPLSFEAAQGWIRYALQHAVKSFILKLSRPWRERYDPDLDDNEIECPVITLDEMDSYTKIETLHLELSLVQLRLPSSRVMFPSLIDLLLDGIQLPAGGGYLLSNLVSSACCPRLQKLRLRHLSFELPEMFCIEAHALLELSLESTYELQFLKLRTPSLQVLGIDNSFDLERFTVSAPRLEHLRFCAQKPLHIDDFHGQLSSVRTLKIQMFSLGETDLELEDRNNASIDLLQRCRLTRCLEVSFEIPKAHHNVDIIKGRIPLLPYVTDLAVDIILWEEHSTGPGIACLLAQCSNIKYLSLQLWYLTRKENQSELNLLCDNNSCHWRSHEFSLDHLARVEFKRLIGTDCEFQFIESILTKASGIQKITISFKQLYWRKGRKHAFKLLPPLDGGLWTTCKAGFDEYELSFEWRRRL